MKAAGLVAAGVLGLVPLAASQYSIDGATAGGALGHAVALGGDVNGDGVVDLLLGAPDSDTAGVDAGEVRVVSGADGSLLLSVMGGAPFDDFGTALAGVGDVNGDGVPDLVVGSPQGFDHQESVFVRLGYAQLLSGSDGSVIRLFQGEQVVWSFGGSFASAIAGPGDLDGDGIGDVAIGEPDADLEGYTSWYAGRLHLYSGADGHEIRQLVGVADISAANAGMSVAPAGDRDGDGVGDLLIGAPYPDHMGSGAQEGISLVSGATGAILWTSPQGAMAWLGLRVVLGGDVDADGTPDVLGSEHSAVVVLSGATGALIRKHPTNPLKSLGGPSAASAGDVNGDGFDDVAVGDPLLPTIYAASAGAVRIYSGEDGSLLAEIVGTQTGERFGAALVAATGLPGISGTALVIGAPGHDGPAGADAGLVRVVQPDGDFQIPQVLTLPGLPPDTGFASALAIPGDVNNDGWDDVSVGEPYDHTAGFNAGSVRVFSGHDGSLLHDLHGLKPYERLGFSVARLGDIDRDGYADLLAAAPFAANPFGPGVVRVWSGRDGSLLRAWTGLSTNDQFGSGVAGAGDVDGDGIPDVVVGAPYDDVGGPNRGAVRVFSGATGAQLLQVLGNESNAEFGSAVAGLGDVNGDGASDIGIGSRLDDGAAGLDAGRVLIVSGATGAVLADAPGSSAFGSLGWALAAVGDLSHDGIPDVLAGEPGDNTAGSGAGRALVLSGADGSIVLSVLGPVPSGGGGRSVAGFGDVNGDGLSELVVGSPNGAGRVDVVDGATGDLHFTVSGTTANDRYGQAVAGGGDLDNNGGPDLVVGAAHAPFFGVPNGSAIVFDIAPAFTPWQSAGAVLPGTKGAPKLTGSGPLLPATTTTLALSNGKPGALSTLVVGFTALAAPFKGGTLVPFPHVLIAGLPIGPAGNLNLSAPWPAGLPPGTALWFQHWFADAAALQGLAASNAVKAVTP